MEKEQDFKKPEYYENRELSWLKFNHRVLNEARDKSIPLLERLKFVSITSSNLDEFFMVRVASLKDMVHANYKKKDIAGMTASEQLEKINERTRELVITIETMDDIALEKALFDAKTAYFENVFSIKPVIKEKRVYG